jgi:RNA polymerase sigma-70 factor (ECF subfamily)
VPPSDEQLVARVIATRDQSAFEQLVKRHQNRVRGFLRHLGADAAKADDLAQETFISAWNKIATLRSAGKFAGWLIAIAYNNHLQGYRRQAGEQRLLAGLDSPDEAGPPTVGEAAVDLPKFLAILSQAERVALVLCYAHGMSHREIAEVIRLPLGTVKSHIARAKAKIAVRFKLDDAYE